MFEPINRLVCSDAYFTLYVQKWFSAFIGTSCELAVNVHIALLAEFLNS
jgi:hypothetical protein